MVQLRYYGEVGTTRTISVMVVTAVQTIKYFDRGGGTEKNVDVKDGTMHMETAVEDNL